MNIDDKLVLLRKSMSDHGIDAYIIPTNDPHQSEYVATHWQSREWISGFTGSSGIAVVTHSHAGIWTDSRYFLQAEKELSQSSFVLHKVIKQFAPLHISFLQEHLASGDTIGIDGWMFSQKQLEYLEKEAAKSNLKVKSNVDLIHEIWTDRPPIPTTTAYEHDIAFCGKSRLKKLEEIRLAMQEKSADYHLVTTLDDIAWIFNIRGADVKCNPVSIAYALISDSDAILFINQEKLDKALLDSLSTDQIRIEAYKDILKYLNELEESKSILVDQEGCNSVLYKAINTHHKIHGQTISVSLKAVKNTTELEHFRSVMIKDGVALVKLFMWLEKELQSTTVSEYDLAIKLAGFRAEQEHYVCESFDAIVGFKGNGAIVHYRAGKDDCAQISNDGILLLDSGGQYLDGTTDTTRTISLGTPTEEQMKSYTLVLKGHIALDQAVFPIGTKGVQLDMLARQHLWNHGMNFLHGTGHGVGFFGQVHEAPQGFSPGISARSKVNMQAGMVTSNEPGYYKEGEYGIRIENLVVTTQSAHEGFLYHENITLCPIDKKLIDKSLMTTSEISWLNDYHQKVYELISPKLNSGELSWLKDKCSAI